MDETGGTLARDGSPREHRALTIAGARPIEVPRNFLCHGDAQGSVTEASSHADETNKGYGVGSYPGLFLSRACLPGGRPAWLTLSGNRGIVQMGSG